MEVENLCLRDLHFICQAFFPPLSILRHPHQSYYLWWDSTQRPVMLTI